MDSARPDDKETGTTSKEEGPEKPADELALAKKQAEEYKTMALYLKADLDNFKKRAAREREEYIKNANESFILEILNAYENLERALDMARKKDDAMAKGLEMIRVRARSSTRTCTRPCCSPSTTTTRKTRSSRRSSGDIR